MNRRAAKRYAARHLALLAHQQAVVIEARYRDGGTWDHLRWADANRVIRALRVLGDELAYRGDRTAKAEPLVAVHPHQAALFEEEDMHVI